MMQNKHIEHPEDCILTGDLSVLDWFTADSDISVKIDGSPAIVWGKNPANGKFFVGTKAVFNKVKIRIAHSHEEIDTFYQGEVARILHACFDSLPRTHSVYQGDFIGFGGSDTYCPNTITYKFPEIVEQSVIIAPHTQYECEDDLRNAIASPCWKVFHDTLDVKWVQVDAEICPHREDIEDICNFAKQMSTLCTFVSAKQSQELKKIINSYIRNGKEVDEHEIAENYDVDINLIRLWKLVYSIKMDLFFFIEREDEIECYINGTQTDHEGYVLHNELGSMKIVDRYEFSQANFNTARS